MLEIQKGGDQMWGEFRTPQPSINVRDFCVMKGMHINSIEEGAKSLKGGAFMFLDLDPSLNLELMILGNNLSRFCRVSWDAV